jgi:diguanylate cyclase (GGDEF)-like protein
MPVMTKETIQRDLVPAAAAQSWEVFLPEIANDQELAETRSALMQAELVIRMQEERIRQLQELATTDELTGLTNRRGFVSAFERELSLARRDADYGGILVMVDLDKFKNINDRFGHQAGDSYLCAVADVLKDCVRVSDTVARLGGDEFALLMTHLDHKSGAKRLAKLEQTLARKSLVLGTERIPLRASFGMAAYCGGESVESVMQSADLRLYGNKARSKKLIAAG